MAKEKAKPAWEFETDFDGAAYHYKRKKKETDPPLEEVIKKINDESSSFKNRSKALNEALEVTNRPDKKEGKGMKKGGMVSASKRADGCAVKGKTRGKMV
jgi:hypothetical protein